MKNLVVQKKLEVWNKVVERANSDSESNRKELWGFIGRRTKGKRRGVIALRKSAGVSVTGTMGKLEVIISRWALVVLIHFLMIVGRRKWIRKCVIQGCLSNPDGIFCDKKDDETWLSIISVYLPCADLGKDY